MKNEKKKDVLKASEIVGQIFRYRIDSAYFAEKKVFKGGKLQVKNIEFGDLLDQNRFLWDEVDKLRRYDVNAAFDRFQSKISSPKQSKQNDNRRWMFGIAASIIICAFCYSRFQ